MKLNLFLNAEESIATLENVHLSELPKVIDASCEHIDCHGFFELHDSVLPNVLKKVAHQGTISFSITNLIKACNDFCNKMIDIKAFSQIAGGRSVYFDIRIISEILQSQQFEIESITSREYTHKITARRV